MAENEEGKTEEATPGQEHKFDTAPLLQILMADDGPLKMAESLDQAYTILAEYLVSDPNTAGHEHTHVLYNLRRLKDALVQGSGWHHRTPRQA